MYEMINLEWYVTIIVRKHLIPNAILERYNRNEIDKYKYARDEADRKFKATNNNSRFS